MDLQLGPLDWGYKTEPQAGRACLGFTGGRCNWPRGRVLGGTSAINYMLYVRGNREDYDRWEAQGNPGWGYPQVLPYFKKSEDNLNPYLASSPYHGTGGPLTVQEVPWRTPLATAFLEAGQEMGFQIRDSNGRQQIGFMLPQATVRGGSRCSSARAFLRPVRSRENLHILLNSRVLRVLISEETKTAYGVRLVRRGRVHTVLTTREVILSAGTLGSAHLLLLSGVGPATHLHSLGIPVLRDLPVGENLQDHYGTGALTFTLEAPLSLRQQRYENLPSFLQYFLWGSGPLTSLGGVEGLAWVNSKFSNASQDWPDLQLAFISGSPASDGGRQVHRVLLPPPASGPPGPGYRAGHVAVLPTPGGGRHLVRPGDPPSPQVQGQAQPPHQEPLRQTCLRGRLLHTPARHQGAGGGGQVCAGPGPDQGLEAPGDEILGRCGDAWL